MSPKEKPAILGGEPFFDNPLRLAIPSLPALSDYTAKLQTIFSSGAVTKGKYLRELEQAIAAHCRVKHAVAVSSCSMGLVLSHSCLELTGEVIYPSFTFMASPLGSAWCNTTPVFVDVDEHTWNIDLAEIEENITSRTSAICATHVFGNPADVEKLRTLASRHGLALVFDAAHGFGSLHDGKPLGANGSCEIFSCSPTKLLQCGEGGIVTTNDDALANSLRQAREYGNNGAYDMSSIGFNGRMSELNAALGLLSLQQLEETAQERNALALQIMQALVDVPGLTWQFIDERNRSSYKDLICLVDESEFGLSRDQFAEALQAENVETRNYYDPPLHRQQFWRERARLSPSGLPVSSRLAQSAIALPLHGRLTEFELASLVAAIKRIHDFSATISKRSLQPN